MRSTNRPSPTVGRSRTRRLVAALGAVATVAAVSVTIPDNRAQAQTARGSRPMLAIMCRYADDPATFGYTADNLQTMFTGGTWNISTYMAETSMGVFNMAGSKAVGWFALPSPKAAYETAGPLTDTSKVATDCSAAAAAGGVDLAPYDAFGFFLNGDLLGASGITSSAPITVAGAPKMVDSIFLGKMGLTSPPLVLHELGHLLGAAHTQNPVDPLGAAPLGGDPSDPNGRRASIGPGYDATNRDRLGWIPADRKTTANAGGVQQFTLQRLTLPAGAGPILVEVPWPDGLGKYVVSARTLTGADALLRYVDQPARGPFQTSPGVQIQSLQTRTAEARLVLSRPGGNMFTPDGVWAAGQTFTDAARGISISVTRFDDTGADITVSTNNGQPATTTTTAPPPPPTVPPPTGLQDNLATAGVMDAPNMFGQFSVRVGPTPNTNATVETDEPRPCGAINNSLWVRFTATGNLTYLPDAAGTSFNAYIAAYKANGPVTSFANLTPIAGACETGISPRIRVPASAGDVIYVQVGSASRFNGDVIVNVGIAA